uniref:Capsule gland specific secretory protein n=1 Tax=Reishia bronni TaxID=578817 RepID=A0A6G9KPB0_9CAEN|nr:capsule gland specific secretory protein [Reishia bronni]
MVAVKFLLVIFLAVVPGSFGGKGKCPDTGLAGIVAQQNEVLIRLVKDQQTIITQLEILKAELQAQIKALQGDLGATQASLQATQDDLKATKVELAVTQLDVKNLQKELENIRDVLKYLSDRVAQKRIGSTYVRWGRKTCPVVNQNSTTLVYSGIVGGKHYTHKGSGTNPLCLTNDPKYDGRVKPSTNGYLYGSEYEGIPELQDQEIPCSVCHTTYSNTIMIPGTNQCPSGWTTQYLGHLVSGYYNHYANQFVCLDGQPEGVSSSRTNQNGFLFYIVVSKCGSLSCPPYQNDKVVTCAVCSK